MTDSSSKESKIEQLFQKLVDYYCNSPDIRNPILQIHILGPVIDFVATTLSQDFNKKRLLQTFQTINEEILRINESMVDFQYIKSEEFYDMLRRVIEYSIKTRHQEKIRWYCRILIGAALLDNVNARQSAEDFLIFLSELTTTDLLVGKEIYEQQKDMPERFDIDSPDNTELKFIVEKKWHEIKPKYGLSEVDFNISLLKLSRAGLIKEIVGMYAGYTGWLYLITPAFKRLMKLIQYANEPTFNYKLNQS